MADRLRDLYGPWDIDKVGTRELDVNVAENRRRRARLFRAVALLASLVVVALTLFGCGGDGDGGSGGAGNGDKGSTVETNGGDGAAGKTDACSLLTPAEVTAAGVNASKGEPADTATGGKGCNYGADPTEGVQVTLQPGGGEAYFAQHKELLTAAKPTSGLGDKAVLDDSNPQQVTVLVLKGDTVLAVGGSIKLADARSLTQKALRRLGG